VLHMAGNKYLIPPKLTLRVSNPESKIPEPRTHNP
jgi:hypothetical protein